MRSYVLFDFVHSRYVKYKTRQERDFIYIHLVNIKELHYINNIVKIRRPARHINLKSFIYSCLQLHSQYVRESSIFSLLVSLPILLYIVTVYAIASCALTMILKKSH